MVHVIEPNKIAVITDEWKMYMNQKMTGVRRKFMKMDKWNIRELTSSPRRQVLRHISTRSFASLSSLYCVMCMYLET
jgi:hypothetical protein